jgi:hypothetical protein
MRRYVGNYSVVNGQVVESDDLKEISTLLDKRLVRVAYDPSNWTTLYQDKSENSWWLLSYEQPEIQGGGIKVLEEIAQDQAMKFIARHENAPRALSNGIGDATP